LGGIPYIDPLIVMTSSESEERSSKKRSRRNAKSVSSEGLDESKKQRGRPRVEASDETAADVGCPVLNPPLDV